MVFVARRRRISGGLIGWEDGGIRWRFKDFWGCECVSPELLGRFFGGGVVDLAEWLGRRFGRGWWWGDGSGGVESGAWGFFIRIGARRDAATGGALAGLDAGDGPGGVFGDEGVGIGGGFEQGG